MAVSGRTREHRRVDNPGCSGGAVRGGVLVVTEVVGYLAATADPGRRFVSEIAEAV